MRRLGLFACVLILTACQTPNGSPTTGQIPTGSQASVGEGRCERVTMTGPNMAAQCTGKVAITARPDGRITFSFPMSDSRMITFAGQDRPNPTPNTDVAALDTLTLMIGSETKSFPVTGSCQYGNYAAGKRTIHCRAIPDDGSSVATVTFRLTSPPDTRIF